MGRKQHKIFIGIVEIAGYYANLAEGLRRTGQEVNYVQLQYHPFQYGNISQKSWVAKAIEYCAKKRFQHRGSAKKKIWDIVFNIVRLPFIVWAIATHDVFIFSYGNTLMGFLPSYKWHYLDIKLIKLLGKKSIVVFNGSDSRPEFIDGFVGIETSQRAHDVRVKKQKLSYLEQYADVLVAYPTITQFFTRPCVNWFAMTFGCALQNARNLPKKEPDKSLTAAFRIVHSPSNPIAKGTARITEAVDNVRKKGYDIELVTISGMAQADVLRALQDCDIVIDQAYSDVPYAAFAVEAMYFGKPVIIAGYAQHLWKEQRSNMPPSIYCKPEEIEVYIEKLITDQSYRKKIGLEAQTIVQQYFTPENVAQDYLRLIDNDIPAEWIFDPSKEYYVGFAGMSKEKGTAIVQELVEHYGESALMLDDKPHIKEQFLQMVALERT